ncbi:MAG: amino acid adenylation domain-containing protein [Thermoanaerobaculia bacterium]
MTQAPSATKGLSPRKRELLELMLEERRKEKGRTGTGPEELPRADRSGPLPLSFVQQRLWFLSQLDPESPAYNIPAAVYLVGRLEAEVLRRSYDRVVERHEDLRTNFHRDEKGEPYAVIAPERRVRMPVIDLSRLEAAAAEEEAQDLVPAVSMVPFDLTRDALVRLRLIRLAPEAHLLLLVVHHIVVDVWSIGVFFRDVGAFYDGLVAGRPPELEPLELQYADYVEWQRRTLEETGELDRQLEYWVRRLEGAPTVIDLPTDFPRPPVQTFRGMRHSMHLGDDVHERLRAVARPEEASLYMAALAVFYVLLHRYTGQHDLLVGTPMANRNRVEFESLVGFFVNTVVLRSTVEGGVSFRQLLRQVRSVSLEAFAHHDLPFERVVNALKLERDLSRNPLYQVDFAFQNLPEVRLSTPGLELRPFVLRETTSRFDLELDLKEAPDGFDGFIRFNTALFERATIERMGRHFGTLLRAAAEDPERPVAALPMLDAAEVEQLVHGWNDTRVALPEGCLSPERIQEWAARTPDAPAVVSAEGIELAYGELEHRAESLARRLAGLGAGPEPVVALALPRCPELVVGLLAVWKAGGAYLPLDLEHPPERLRFLLDDAGVRSVVTTPEVGERLPVLSEGGRELVRLGDSPDRAEVTPPVPADPRGAAYVLYTSGSTGRPKGVVVHHRALANYLDWCERAYGSAEGRGSLVHSPLGFDLTVTSILAPLAAGRPVRLVAEGEGIEPLAGALLDGMDLGLLKLTPAHLEALSGLIDPSRAGGRARTIVVGGEALHRTTLDFWRRNAPESRLVNEYGPTETVVGCAAHVVPPEGDAPGGSDPDAVPIGRPIQNAQLHLADAGLHLVPPGARGEIVVGGDGVARGYLGRPGLTAERFVPDPFATGPGGRLYRTGDRARRGRHGRLVFQGRIDHQVKVRGYRIEPGEIESVLDTHPDVQSAVVVARADLPGGATGLVAYVTAPKARNLRPEDLRDHLAERLPEHMVPAFFVFLPALPLTVNGKVDRQALPAPDAVGSRDEDYVAPRTPTEVQVARIWADVLGVDRVSVTDRFFELGGQSMLAVQVVSRVRDALQVELPVQSLFNDTTVASLSTEVDAATERGAMADAPPIEPVSRNQDLPLSFAQERLWFIDQLMPGLTAYHIPGAVRMRGELDRPALERALREIVDRHEVLRTTFSSRRGRPVQVVHPAMALPLLRVDLRGFPPGARDVHPMELARRVVRAPFDLSRGPLIRAVLVELSDDEVLFVLSIHHIVYDMWSRDIFLGELVTLYEAFSEGRSSNLPPLGIQYADFAAWQRRWLTGEVLDAQLEFWRERLGGLAPLELPTDRPRPAVQSLRGARVSHLLSAGVTKALKRTARRRKVTLFVVLLSGFYALLQRYAGVDDVAVGSPIANRNRTEIEPLMGFFANTLVLRTLVEPGDRGVDLMARVRRLTLDAYAHQDLAFEKLVEVLQPERDLARQPLFQVMFNFLVNYQPPTLELPRLTLETETVHTGGVPFDFTLSMFEADGRLHVMVDYSQDLFDRTTVERVLHHFDRLLGALASRPEDAVADLAMLSPPERHQLLVDWNDSSAAGPAPELSPVERLGAVAQEAGDRTAVVSGTSVLTFSELAGRAEAVAGALRERGVGPETVVGIALERSPEMVVALFGVLAAGGAYLPLDPKYPRERLRFTIEDSGCAVTLTTAALAPDLPDAGGEILLLDGEAFAAAPAGSGPPTRVHPDQAAYVIYTSGSTGRPKGVVVPHRPLAGYLDWCLRSYGLEAGSGSVVHSPLGFDLTVTSLLAPLAAGRPVRLAGGGEGIEPLEEALLASRDLSLLKLTPSHLEGLAERIGPRRLRGRVRTLVVGGEPLGSETARAWIDGAPGTRLVNEYGPTEAVVGCSVHEVGREPSEPEATVPIGRPIQNARLHGVGPGLAPVPPGVAGELLAGGPGLARGYLRRPAWTAEGFVPDPFAARPGARLYRTGDQVRRRADGRLSFLGRLDDQVKLRGHRVEPGEVRAVLERHPSLAACAVVAQTDDGSTRLVAYPVAAGDRPGIEELRSFLADRLPAFMIPSAWIYLDELPWTIHGKLDRAALPAPDGVRQDEHAPFVAPRTETESVLAEIWSEVLALDRVGAEDDFFALGGHSLLATQVVSRASERFGVELPLRQFFARSTVAGQAEAIESLQWLSREPEPAAEEEEEEGTL